MGMLGSIYGPTPPGSPLGGAPYLAATGGGIGSAASNFANPYSAVTYTPPVRVTGIPGVTTAGGGTSAFAQPQSQFNLDVAKFQAAQQQAAANNALRQQLLNQMSGLWGKAFGGNAFGGAGGAGGFGYPTDVQQAIYQQAAVPLQREQAQASRTAREMFGGRGTLGSTGFADYFSRKVQQPFAEGLASAGAKSVLGAYDVGLQQAALAQRDRQALLDAQTRLLQPFLTANINF